MSTWTVGKKLYSGFGALAALLIILGGSAIWILGSQNDQFDNAANGTARKLDLALQMRGHAIDARGILRRIQLSGYTRERKAFEEAQKEANTMLGELGKLTDDLSGMLKTEEGKKAVAEAVATAKAWGQAKDQVVAMIDAGQPEEARTYATANANPLVAKYLEQCDFVVKQQRDMLDSDVITADSAYATAWWIVVSILLLASGISAAVILSVRSVSNSLRQTATELRQTSEQVVSASTQVSTAAQSLSQGATEQAASLEESSASMEEMGSMTAQNAQNAGEAANLMQEVDRQVTASNRMLGEMVTSMKDIQESSSKVSKIIKTIDEIAFQTNILALNAAVEAARAGEAGMGFAVVADEVRSLAQRAAQAARDTASLIEESSHSAEQGSTKVQQVAESIAQFTESVVKVKAIADGVSAASQQQAQGIKQVSTAIQQMEKVTQTTAATAEESAAASEELNAQAEMAMHLVEGLEALVGRADGAARSSSRPKAQPAHRAPNVVKLQTSTSQPKGKGKSAEEAIPFGDSTGTFGSF